MVLLEDTDVSIAVEEAVDALFWSSSSSCVPESEEEPPPSASLTLSVIPTVEDAGSCSSTFTSWLFDAASAELVTVEEDEVVLLLMGKMAPCGL